MPDTEGNTKAEETSTPLHAYKDGRSEDVNEGDMGVDGSGIPDSTEDRHGQTHDGGPGGASGGEAGREPAPESSGDNEGSGSGWGTETGAVAGPEEGGPGLGQEPDDKPTRGA